MESGGSPTVVPPIVSTWAVSAPLQVVVLMTDLTVASPFFGAQLAHFPGGSGAIDQGILGAGSAVHFKAMLVPSHVYQR